MGVGFPIIVSNAVVIAGWEAVGIRLGARRKTEATNGMVLFLFTSLSFRTLGAVPPTARPVRVPACRCL